MDVAELIGPFFVFMDRVCQVNKSLCSNRTFLLSVADFSLVQQSAAKTFSAVRTFLDDERIPNPSQKVLAALHRRLANSTINFSVHLFHFHSTGANGPRQKSTYTLLRFPWSNRSNVASATHLTFKYRRHNYGIRSLIIRPSAMSDGDGIISPKVPPSSKLLAVLSRDHRNYLQAVCTC